MTKQSLFSQYRGIYAITSPDYFTANDAYKHSKALLAAGIKIIQLRDKVNAIEACLTIGREINKACQEHDAIFLVNDNIELARELGADGVHLGQTDGSMTEARTALGESAIVGITCHDRLDLALEAQSAGANYVAFGRAFQSLTKPGGPIIRPKQIAVYKRQLQIPVVAIGGIEVNNIEQFGGTGVPLLAVINELYQQGQVQDNAHRLMRAYLEAEITSQSVTREPNTAGVTS